MVLIVVAAAKHIFEQRIRELETTLASNQYIAQLSESVGSRALNSQGHIFIGATNRKLRKREGDMKMGEEIEDWEPRERGEYEGNEGLLYSEAFPISAPK